MKAPFRIGVTVTALAGVLLLTPTAAIADTPSGDPFGQHVRICAQTMGLSGSHNPAYTTGSPAGTGWPATPDHPRESEETTPRATAPPGRAGP